MLAYLCVAIGGAIGSVARYWLSGVIAETSLRHGAILPWNTLVVNVTGSFIIGLLAALHGTRRAENHRAGHAAVYDLWHLWRLHHLFRRSACRP